MKITSNEEYGLRILLRIAKLSKESSGSLVTLNEISKHEGITTDYAMIFITCLKNAGFVESVRGKNGGYKLTKEPKNITLHDISKSLTSDIFGENYCDKHSGGQMEHCVHTNDCSIRSVWSTVTNVVNNVLSNITLEQLMDNDEESLNKLLNERIEKGELVTKL